MLEKPTFSIERGGGGTHLTANEKDEESDGSPQDLLLELNLTVKKKI